ncbi:RNA polymerase sigma-70 factor [Mucilaginibacter gynuensis]|uniref:RNA polymerase sigma-70 factor n=1 Tax=Mucilaginibacter gynuensis TaxID=1302236 RepID=A0ABP8FWF4_9SPHI
MNLKALSGFTTIQPNRGEDERAFNNIFDQYFKKLYQYTLSKVNDDSLAEELVMDLMLSLWHKRDNPNIKVNDLSAYLFRAMKNIIYSHFRKKELETMSLTDIETDPVAYQTAGSKLAVNEIQQQYKISLEMLSPQRRKVFKLSREEAMSQSEIARHLNLSVKTVESHITASLQFMREHFKDYADLMLLIVILKKLF